MTKINKPEKTEIYKGLVGKQMPWLRAYLNESDPKTFLNKTESARVAGYNCNNDHSLMNIGCQNYSKLSKRISQWLDENGLSENTLKLKLVSLLNAKETKFQKINGAVTEKDLPDGVTKIVSTGVIESDKDGVEYSTGETILGIEVESISIQQRSLDMALKVKGLYAKTEVEITNLADFGARLNAAHKRTE